MKNRGKNKSVAFIILFSAYRPIYGHTHTQNLNLSSSSPVLFFSFKKKTSRKQETGST